MRIRSFLSAAAGLAVGLALLVPAGSAAAADDLVIEAPTDGSVVRVTSTERGQLAKVTFEAVEGDHLIVSCYDRSSNGYPKLDLAGPDAQPAAIKARCQSGGIDLRFLPWSGKYTLTVRDEWGPIDVQLRLSTFPNLFDRAQTDGTPVVVRPEFNGQDALVSFNATAGERIYISCRSEIQGDRAVGILLDPRGRRLSGGVAEIHQCTYPDWARPPVPYLTFFDTQTIETTGRHTIVIDNNELSRTPVGIRVFKVPADVTVEAPLDGTPTTVKPTIPGQSAKVTFSLQEGERVQVMCGENTGNGELTLLGTDGKQLAPDSGYAYCSLNHVLFERVTAPRTGTYTVLYDPADPYLSPFTARVYKIPAAVTGEVAVDGEPITLATTVPGQSAQATFTVGENDRISVECLFTPHVSAYYENARGALLGADGKVLDKGWCQRSFDGSYANLLGPRTLETAGTYTLTFDPSTVGAVSVRVKKVTDTPAGG